MGVAVAMRLAMIVMAVVMGVIDAVGEPEPG